MKTRVGMTLVIVAASSCAPTRSYLFDPIAASVEERTGVRPEWRTGWARSAAGAQRIREVLAKPLTAEGAALIAVLNSSQVQEVYAELGVAGAALTSARTVHNPELDAELLFPLDSGGETRIELSAVQDVTDLLAILPRARGADASLKAARRRAVATTVAAAAHARARFYAAAAATQQLSLRRTIAEAAGASAALARSLHAAGNITDLALTRELVFEEEALLEVTAAEAAATSARERLNATLGLHGQETGWRTAETVPDVPERLEDLRDLEREAVTASLELEALRWDLEAGGQQIGLARFESFVPRLGLGAAAKREDGWHAGPIVTLSLPIFDWGSGKRAGAWAEVRRLQHRYTGAAVTLRAMARAARTRLIAAHARAHRMKTTVLPLRERLVDESLLQYNAMNVDAFELLVVRREQIEAEVRYIEALRDYWVARTEVDQLRAGGATSEELGEELDHERD